METLKNVAIIAVFILLAYFFIVSGLPNLIISFLCTIGIAKLIMGVIFIFMISLIIKLICILFF